MEKKGKDTVVAFCLSRYFNEDNIHIINVLLEEAKKRNCKVQIFTTISDFFYADVIDMGEIGIFDQIQPEMFDAVIVLSETFKQDTKLREFVEYMQERETPIFSIDKYLPGCIHVKFAYQDSFRKVVQHMIEDHGYTDTVFMGGVKGNIQSEERLEVYKEVLAQNQIPFREEDVYYGGFWDGPTKQEMNRFFASGRKLPQAFICANDEMALCVCDYLQKRGISVPKDVAVSGFDGIMLEKFNHPRLTTVVCDYRAMFHKIFDVIMDMQLGSFEKKDVQDSILIDSKLKKGRSCGCAKKKTKNSVQVMKDLKICLYQERIYEGLMYQMSANYSKGKFDYACAQAIKDYMVELQYENVYFCLKDTFFKGILAKESFPNRVNYRKDSDKMDSSEEIFQILELGKGDADVVLYENIPYSRIYDSNKNRQTVLNCDKVWIVLQIHIRGVEIGVLYVKYDPDSLWYFGLCSFMIHLRYLLELQSLYNAKGIVEENKTN